jgi:preprotein translocase subunit YajC
MFISKAYAATHTAGGSDIFLQLLPFLLIFVIIYLLILRPQQKRVKAHRDMVHSVQKGDTVVTQGGILGKVTKVIDGNEVQIEIADGVKVKIVRSMIAEVRGK